MKDQDSNPYAPNSGLVTSIVWLSVIGLLSGAALVPIYRASMGEAHSTTAAISRSPFFGFMRDIHHWSSALLLLCGCAYVLSGLFRRTYRRPGQWLWISTIGIVVTGTLLQLTGHLLPFDAHAVRTAVIETGIAENVPLVGTTQARMFRGGDSVGPQTLSLWYRGHVWIFTALMLAMVGWTWVASKRAGVNPARPAWLILTSGLVLLLAIGANSPLGPAATAYDMGSFEASPEWYVLPLHTLLNLSQAVHPSLGFIGTMVLPGVVLLGLLLLPWIKIAERPGFGRLFGAGAIVGLAGLVLASIDKAAPLVGDQLAAVRSGWSPNAPRLDPKLIAEGRKLFEVQGCSDCHRINGKGGTIGPDLSHEAERRNDLEWHVQHLKEPRSMVPSSTMPSFRQLDDQKLNALAQYLASLRPE